MYWTGTVSGSIWCNSRLSNVCPSRSWSSLRSMANAVIVWLKGALLIRRNWFALRHWFDQLTGYLNLLLDWNNQTSTLIWYFLLLHHKHFLQLCNWKLCILDYFLKFPYLWNIQFPVNSKRRLTSLTVSIWSSWKFSKCKQNILFLFTKRSSVNRYCNIWFCFHGSKVLSIPVSLSCILLCICW